MKLTAFGKRFMAVLAFLCLGFVLAGCLTTDNSKATKAQAQANINDALSRIYFDDSITENVALPSSFAAYPDLKYEWSSSEEDLIKIENVDTTSYTGLQGTVTRPALDDARVKAGNDYVEVVLTVVLSHDSTEGVVESRKAFTVKVKCQTYDAMGTITEVRRAFLEKMVSEKWSVKDNGYTHAQSCTTYGRVVLVLDDQNVVLSDGQNGIILYSRDAKYTEEFAVNDLVQVTGPLFSYYGCLEVAYASGTDVSYTKLDESSPYAASCKLPTFEKEEISTLLASFEGMYGTTGILTDADAAMNVGGHAYNVYAKLTKDIPDNGSTHIGANYALEDPNTGETIVLYYKSTNNYTTTLDKYVGQYVNIDIITHDIVAGTPDLFRALYAGNEPTAAEAPTLSDKEKVELVKTQLTNYTLKETYYNGDELTLPTTGFPEGVTVVWAADPAAAYVDGKVVATTDGTLKLTATITCNTESATVERTVKIAKELKINTIAEVVKLKDDATFTIECTIDCLFGGTYRDGFVYDETGSIMCYTKLAYEPGTKVRITGVKGSYNGTPQIKTITTIEVIEEGSWKMRTPVETTIAEINEWTAETAKFGQYLKVTGILEKDGNYYQLTKDGKSISLYNSVVEGILAELANSDSQKEVTLNVYFYGNQSNDFSGAYRVVFVGREGEYVLPELSDEETVNLFWNTIEVAETATGDFALPSATDLVWSVKTGTAIKVEGNTATVTRPAAGQDDATVVLLATYTYKGKEYTKEFTVTVKAQTEVSGGTTITYNFTNQSLKAGTRFEDEATFVQFMKDCCTSSNGDLLIGATVSTSKPVYAGDGTAAGQSTAPFASVAGMLKMGKSGGAGEFTLVFDGYSAVKVEIKCHDWYKKTSDTGTPKTKSVTVNEATGQAAPYNADATPEVLTFEFNPSSEITITSSERLIIFEMVIYFE